MANVLIVNPSLNMHIAANEIRMLGNNVSYAFTNDVPMYEGKRVFYFLPGITKVFTTEESSHAEKDERVYLFKKNIFSRFKMMGYKEDFASIFPNIDTFHYNDIVIHKSRMLNYEKRNISAHDNYYNTCKEVFDKNDDKVILTPYILGQGGEKIIYWETECDIETTFGNDYFVFITGNNRIEAFVNNNLIITIGKHSDHIKDISQLVPIVAKYKFKNVYESSIARNSMPWLVNVGFGKHYLINDYSFGRLSILMSSGWSDKFSNFINFKLLK